MENGKTPVTMRFDASSGNWNNSEIKAFLNSSFWDAFNSDVQEAIVTAQYMTAQYTLGGLNEWRLPPADTPGSSKVFLLSYEEATNNKYFINGAGDDWGLSSFDRVVDIPKNGKGTHERDEHHTLVYDIKGNGSNIKVFEIVPK